MAPKAVRIKGLSARIQKYAGVPRNSPEFRELHGQNKNRYRAYAHHCGSSHFTPMSRYAPRASCIRTALDGRECETLSIGRSLSRCGGLRSCYESHTDRVLRISDSFGLPRRM